MGRILNILGTVTIYVKVPERPLYRTSVALKEMDH